MTRSLRRAKPREEPEPAPAPPVQGPVALLSLPGRAIDLGVEANHGATVLHPALARISAAITGSAEPQQAVAEAAEAANAALGGCLTMVWVRSLRGSPEIASVTRELPAPLLAAMTLAAEGSPVTRAAVRSRLPFTLYGPEMLNSPLGKLLHDELAMHSLVAAPLLRGKDVFGMLVVAYDTPGHVPDQSALSNAAIIAGYVTAAVKAARSNVEADSQLRTQTALHQISEAMVSGGSVDAVLHQIAESSLAALRADRVAVWRYEEGSARFILGAEAGILSPAAERRAVLPAEGSGALAALTERQVRVFRNAQGAAHTMGKAGKLFANLAFDTVAIWPVIHEDQPLGVLVGCYKAEQRLHERDVGLGETIANHAAAALHAADVREHTELHAAELQALTDLGRMVAQGPRSAGLLDLAVVARRAVGSATFTIWLRDAGSGRLELGATAAEPGLAPEVACQAGRRPEGNTPQAAALRGLKTVHATGLADRPAHMDNATCLCDSVHAPIMHNGVVLGVVSAGYLQHQGRPTNVDGALQSVASHVSYALVGLRLQQQVASHEREVRALRKISAAAAASIPSPSILAAVSEAVHEAVQANTCDLWVYDTASDGLYLTGAPGVHQEWASMAGSPQGEALRAGRVTIRHANHADGDAERGGDSRAGGSVLLLPIGEPSEPLGVLTLGFGKMLTPKDAEVLVATALAGHAATALGRANALEDRRVTEERLRMVSATSADLTYSLRLTDTGASEVEWVSEGLTDMCGYDLEGLVSAGGWESLVHPDDLAHFLGRRARLAAGHVHVTDYRIITRTGEVRVIRDRARPIWNEALQRAERVFGAARDITDEVRTQQALEALEQVAPATLDALSARIAILDAEGVAVAVNRAWRLAGAVKAQVGLTPPVGQRSNYLALCDAYRGALAPAAARLAAGIRTVMAGHRREFRLEYCVPGDEAHWLVATVTPLRADARSVVVAHEDITDRKRAEEALVRQARFDPLTGLPNRTMLLERLEECLNAAAGSAHHPGLLIMDLDRFKEVNDSFGHEMGDVLLGLVADRLVNALQEQYLVARIGGDEFAVLVPGNPSSAAPERVADTVILALRPPFLVDGLVFDIQASVGVAKYPEHGVDMQALLRRADIAMYVAKHSGTGMAVYSQEQDHNQPRRLSLLAELRKAIDEDQLHLVYHPQVELRTGEVQWVEALVRWSHPTLGVLPPDEFIPIAEQSGLIYQLTRWLLRRALRQAASWHRQGISTGVAVNFSARDLQLPSLPDFVAASLTRYRVPASRLKIEITESSLIEETEQVLRGVSQLRARGVKVVLDDFGMGYASLTHLKRLPVDELKIDKSFVQDLRVSALDAAIVRMTIELGHQMGASVVAEGVEDAETHRMLIDLGCDAAQGFYLAEPAPPDRFRDWMLRRLAEGEGPVG